MSNLPKLGSIVHSITLCSLICGYWQRILKSGARTYGAYAVDHVWFTCCALHNWLLEVDGLSKTWVGGIRQLTSDWDGEIGSLEFDVVRVGGTKRPSPFVKES